jgi:pimeloyl-ACP methyl ester carboxylesterase
MREQPVTGLVAAQETISLRPDSRPILATIDVPALVIVGELDVITPPADAEAMVAGLADSRLVVLPGAGHLTPIERPREVGEAVLDFLREVSL